MSSALRFPVHAAAAFALAAALLLTTPRAAAAEWFGAPDMNLPANVTFTCSAYPLYGLYPTGATSCTWYTIARFGETNPLRSNIVPKGVGSITALRIRTGAQTGPMRLTIYKSLRAVATGAETTCCVGKDESPTFTPPADAITEIPLARPIPVYNGPEGADMESFDSIAISLMDNSAVIPANYDSTAYTNGAALYPYVQPGEERFGQPVVVDPYTSALNKPTGPLATRGFQVLLQADWQPAPATPAPTPVTSTPVQNPVAPVEQNVVTPAQILRSALRVRRGAVGVPLLCKLDAACKGLLRLQAAKAAAAAAPLATYGSRSFTIAAGRRATVSIRLTPRARVLLRKRHRLVVWANASIGNGASKTTVSKKLTLR